MNRSVVPVGPMLALVFTLAFTVVSGLAWLALTSVIEGLPAMIWLVTVPLTASLYAIGMTSWMAWRMTDGGRRPIRVPQLRPTATVTTSEPLATIRLRLECSLRELGATPIIEDSRDGLRGRGTTKGRAERLEVVVERTGAAYQVVIRSEPSRPWVIIDVAGRNEGNVRCLVEAIASPTTATSDQERSGQLRRRVDRDLETLA